MLLRALIGAGLGLFLTSPLVFTALATRKKGPRAKGRR